MEWRTRAFPFRFRQRECLIVYASPPFRFTPRDADMEEVIRDIESVPGVDAGHNVHLWNFCPNNNVVDACVNSCESGAHRPGAIRQEIRDRLKKYRIRHSTLESEYHGFGDCRIVGELMD